MKFPWTTQKGRPVILFTSTFIPEQGINGAYVYSWKMLNALRKNYSVVLFVPWHSGPVPKDICYDKLVFGESLGWVNKCHWRARALWEHIIDCLSSIHIRIKYREQWKKYETNPLFWRLSNRSLATLDRLFYSCSPVAIIANYAQTAVPPLVMASYCSSRILRLINTIDCQSSRVATVKRMGYQPRDQLTVTEETDVLSLADVLIAIQKEEQAQFQNLLPERESLLATCPFEPIDCGMPQRSTRNVLFVGGTAQHNKDGIAWFLKSVWPDVVRVFPDAVLHICGKICSSAGEWISEGCPGVILHGFCESMAPFYKKANVVINPCLYGSGLKIKNIEAMAHGRCLVTTPSGAQGLMEHAHDALLVADVDSYASVIIDCLGDYDMQQRVGSAARRCVEQYFSPEACFSSLINRLEKHVREFG